MGALVCKSDKGRLRELTHWNTQQADTQLQACNNIEHFQYTRSYQPLVCSESEPKAEDVLEYEEACECFDGNVSYKYVRRASDTV